MKKFLVYILIILLPITVLINPLYFYFWKLNWKKQINKSLKADWKISTLSLLKFSKNDLKNGKLNIKFIHSKEFNFNGKMYDVVATNEEKDSIAYLCYLDIREMLYISSLLGVNFKFENFLPLLPIIKIIQISNFEFEKLTFEFKNLNYLISIKKILNNIFYLNIIIDIKTPPPKF